MYKSISKLAATFTLSLAISLNAAAQQTWTINFKDSDIQEVIKFIADITGKTVVIDPRVKGRVKVISQQPLTEPELLDLFRTILVIHDFSLVEVNNVLRVIPLKDARSSPVPVAEADADASGFLTQVIQLRNIAAAKVLPSIRPLVPQHSHLSAYDPSNAIIITDSAENIARIRSLIEQLDQSATPVTDIVELKYANAADLAKVLDSINQTDKKNRSPVNSIDLTADARNNAILVTGEDLERARVTKLIRRLDKPKAQTGNVRVVYLDYAKAKDVAATLTKVMANLSKLGPGGGKGSTQTQTAATVEADEDTNSLLITASGDELSTLLDVVTRLDIRRAQVLVEAIIAEVTDNDAKNLGVEWLYNNTENGILASSTGSGRIAGVGEGVLGLQNDPDDPVSLAKLATSMVSTAGTLLGAVGGSDNESFLGLINALESQGKTNILSTPILLTMDNHEASFTVGDNIPIKTGSQTSNNGNFSPFTTIQREDVGIKLTVTPQVNAGDKVLLDIAQEVSSLGAQTEDGFITSKRKIETQVLAASGEIIVLGGLIEDKQSKSEQRVPLLGRIPLIGALFRNKTASNTQTNLMVFIRASVMRNDGSMDEITLEKYRHIRGQQIDMQNNGFLRLRDNGVTLPPMSELKERTLEPYAPETQLKQEPDEPSSEPDSE